MHQSRRILRLDRSIKPLHRYNGSLNSGHNYRAPANAPSPQDRRVYHPMFRWSVSKLPNLTCHTPISNNPSNTQRNRRWSLAHHNPRPRIPLRHSKPRSNLLNRILQFGSRSKCRRGNSLWSIPESHQQQVPPQTSGQLA